MKNLLLGIILWAFAHMAPAQQTITQEIADDGFVEVPLEFVFPYYGQLFTNSWMFDNGVVSFYSPFNGYSGGQDYFSQPFSAELGGQFNYMIAPLWTDLINYSGTFTTQGNPQFQRYSWNNISQWGYPDNLNTFSLEIYPTGEINVQYDNINISEYSVSAGITGNLTQGEFEQIFYASDTTTTQISNWNTYSEVNMCAMDVFSSPDCPGYEQAYFDQQCSLDPLYDNQCSGYEVAYFDQQCSLDPLYDNQCSGYEVAYFDQQCSFDIFYSSQCPGYEVAYFDQQCSLDPLYDNQCSGYEVAYLLANPIITIEEFVATQDPSIETTIEQQEIVEVTELSVEVIEIAEVVTMAETVQETAKEESSQETEKTLSPSLLRLALSLASDAGPVSSTTQSNQQAESSDQSFNTTNEEQQENLELVETNTSASTDITTNEQSIVESTSISLNLELLELEQSLLTDNQIKTEETESEISVSNEQEIADEDTTDYVIELSQQQLNNNTVSTSNTTNLFSNNSMQQVLALGGNITEILNTTVPDFSRYEVKPPTQDEQVQTAKVENTLDSMSTEEIESQAEIRIGSMDPESQAIALQLIGYKPGFDQYGGMLVDQSNWYLDRGMYTNNRVPAASSSNLLFGAQDQKHQELMSLQYRR